MPVIRLCKALVAFSDGSFLFVELSKKVEPKENILFCSTILGLPEGVSADHPNIAASINRLSTAGTSLEILIPLTRINGISIIEEYIRKEIASDVEELWADNKK